MEESAGFEPIEFTIPHIFLPPRFEKASQKRNMLLTIDMELVAHIFWEGASEDQVEPLRPAQVRQLLRYCNKRMTQYRSDLGVFGRFVDSSAENPFCDPREEAESYTLEPKDVERLPVKRMKEKRVQTLTTSLGGESPLPELNSEY